MCLTNKTEGKLRFCVGTNGKHVENVGVALEPMENARKHMLRVGNYRERTRNICF